MIEIKPHIQHQSVCPHCQTRLQAQDILWQGIHVCAVSKCPGCQAGIIEDLRVGQALYTPYQIDVNARQMFGDESSKYWYGLPMHQSLVSPSDDLPVYLQVEKRRTTRNVIILNCIDFLYGHSLLKLLNATAHLRDHPELGLIVIVPQFLRWLVPQDVAEIWTVNIPLAKAQAYYPALHQRIQQECERFESIYVSLAHSHPRDYDISLFTGVDKHDFGKEPFRITYIWREDRPWWHFSFILWILRKHTSVLSLLQRSISQWQNLKIRRLFAKLRNHFPDAVYTVAGQGTTSHFPTWIDDQRVNRYTEDIERRSCQVYAESRLVIGVHGSSMLLPSGHAGMVLDLMPNSRWGNLAQDVLYQQSARFQSDERMTSWRYRYLPINTPLGTVYNVAESMLAGLPQATKYYEASWESGTNGEHLFVK